ncbi:MAG: glycosyltransferase family 4 protein [Chthoniobacteraceae bacterium]
MRILVLCYEYPPIGGGGGRVAKSIAQALVARGHDVRVQTAALGWKSSRGMIGGVDVFRKASGRRAPDTCRVHEMASYCATSFLPTLRHIREWRPEVIHAHFAVPTGVIAWLVHRVTGVPYVLTAHLGDVPGGVPEQTDTLFKFAGGLAARVWRDAAACTAVSTFVQELAERAYARKVERILNGIDLSDAPLAPPEAMRRRHLVFVGRFNPQKRPDFLIEALRWVTHSGWKLTMIGDGPMMTRVRSMVSAQRLDEFVTMRGWLDAREVDAVLREADILCMPSSSEGMPVAAVEALKHGLAIMASDIPGVRDVVEDGVNGFRLPVNDVEGFARKLDWLLRADETLLAMKRASWKKARDFDLAAIASQYEAVLKAACR